MGENQFLYEELRSIRGIKRNLGKNELNVELRTWTPWLLAGELSKSGNFSFCLRNGWKYHRIDLCTWPHAGGRRAKYNKWVMKPQIKLRCPFSFLIWYSTQKLLSSAGGRPTFFPNLPRVGLLFLLWPTDFLVSFLISRLVRYRYYAALLTALYSPSQNFGPGNKARSVIKMAV